MPDPTESAADPVVQNAVGLQGTAATKPSANATIPEGRQPKPNRGDILDLTTHSFAFEGKAVARREDGYVVFIEGALANEKVRAEIVRAKGKHAEAKLVEVVEASRDRRAPICPYFGTCGGCALQHMTYEAQLFWKRSQVRDLFERIGKIPDPQVREVMSSHDREFHYRNKMEFSFSEERWLTEDEIGSDSQFDRFALGLHVRNRFNRVIDTKVCFLPQPVAVDILNFTRTFTRSNDLGVHHPERNPTGLMRYLMIKTSFSTNEIMVNLVTSRDDAKVMEEYTRELLATVPGITTVINNINERRAQIAVGDYENIYHGPGTITDRIGRANFQISANSFFQANTPQAERLYQVAADFAELRASDRLWDLYCGTGTISLFVADKVRQVLGVELVESAVRDARSNAKANGVTNVDFIASDLRHALTTPQFLSEHPKPDVMIIDPPRSGMHGDVVREVLKLAPERIAYISCDPSTQARDIEMMSEKYEVLDLQPVDMFPQTFHIENVAKLRLRK